MALPSAFSSNLTVKPTGTLESLGLYTNPSIPRNSQAPGMQGTDGRAYTRNVRPNELAMTHLNEMTSGDSKYIQNARQRGLETAARRGMLNSSIAAGNAERAAIESAAPFAQQAAGAYGQAQTENLGYLNQNLMQERDIQNRALIEMKAAQELAGAQSSLSEAMSEENQNRYRMFQENLAYEGEQRGLDRAHDFGRAEQGFGHDLGRMGQEYGYDIGRLGYQQDFQSREAVRDYHRAIGLQDNQYSNQRYNNFADQLGSYRFESAAAVRDFMLSQFDADPSTSMQDMDGFRNYMGYQIDDDIDMFLGSLFGSDF